MKEQSFQNHIQNDESTSFIVSIPYNQTKKEEIK